MDAHFTGSSKAGFFGGCIGLGGAFDLTIAATRYYRDGTIGFREVRVVQVRAAPEGLILTFDFTVRVK